MGMNVSIVADINERYFYRELAAVWRMVGTSTGGATKQELQPVTELSAIPCRVSVKAPDSDQDRTASHSPLVVTATLFCAPEHKLQAGDTFDITNKQGEVSRWVGGVPSKHSSHQEVSVILRGRA